MLPTKAITFRLIIRTQQLARLCTAVAPMHSSEVAYSHCCNPAIVRQIGLEVSSATRLLYLTEDLQQIHAITFRHIKRSEQLARPCTAIAHMHSSEVAYSHCCNTAMVQQQDGLEGSWGPRSLYITRILQSSQPITFQHIKRSEQLAPVLHRRYTCACA